MIHDSSSRRAAFGVFLVALSGLMFEIGLTRIFSATIWYHFAFVAISVALLGWGLGGFALHLLRHRVALSLEKAAVLTLLYALAMPLGLALIVRFPFHPERLPLYFVVSLVPFLLAGAALSMVFALLKRDVGRLYFADLLGASLGALAVTALLSWLGGEGAVLAVALAPLVAAACFWPRLVPRLGPGLRRGGAGRGRQRADRRLQDPQRPHQGPLPPHGRGSRRAHRPDRLELLLAHRRGLGPRHPRAALHRLRRLDQPAPLGRPGREPRAAEPLAPRAGLPAGAAPPGAGDRPGRRLGRAGGAGVGVAEGDRRRDEPAHAALRAPLRRGSRQPLRPPAGRDADLSEGRNFLARTERRWDVVFLGFVDSWAAVASGGLSLSENYLYTTDAFRAYYDHLSPDGLLTIMRWDTDIPRLVANAVALLGWKEASERVVVLLEKRGTPEDPPQMTFMLRRRPFTPAEVEQVLAWSEARPVIVPGRPAEAPYDALLSGRQTLAEYEAAAPRLVGPVFDDRPFYFAQYKPWGVPRTMLRSIGVIVLPLFGVLAVLVAVGRPRDGGGPAYAASVAYFACLGVGFIMVELCLLQNLTLLLGHPIFTLSILLFTLLAAGGLGSAFSARFERRKVCLTVAGLGVLYALALPVLRARPCCRCRSSRASRWPWRWSRPLGFCHGHALPRGARPRGPGAVPGRAVLLGPQRRPVGGRLGGDHGAGGQRRLPPDSGAGQPVLRAGRAVRARPRPSRHALRSGAGR